MKKEARHDWKIFLTTLELYMLNPVIVLNLPSVRQGNNIVHSIVQVRESVELRNLLAQVVLMIT